MSSNDWNEYLESVSKQARAMGLGGNSLTERLKMEYQELEESRFLRFYEPRKIQTPPGYLSFKCVAAGLWSAITECHFKAYNGIPQIDTEISACGVCYQVIDYGVPVYYVAEDFIRAVAATELPSDFIIGDLHWPMPAMVLGFPTRFMREYLGRETCYVNAATVDAMDNLVCRKMPFLQPIMVPVARVGWHWYTFDGQGNLGSYVGAYHRSDRVDLAVASRDYVDYTHDSTPEQVKSDKEASELLSALMLKLLVILNTRPSLVVPGTCERKAKLSGKHPKSELWSPNIIGGAYHIIRGPVGTGTHASPRWHWRKGHLTHQRKGAFNNPDFISINSLPRTEKGEINWEVVSPETKEKFWACHERKWLEPTLINFDDPEEPCQS